MVKTAAPRYRLKTLGSVEVDSSVNKGHPNGVSKADVRRAASLDG